MSKIAPRTMQVIPPDWQHTVELHIVAMDNADDGDRTYDPFTPSTGRFERLDSGYALACAGMVDYIETHFGSVEAFDDFLKSDTRHEAHKSGLTINLAEQWDTSAMQEKDGIAQANFIKDVYNKLYKVALHDISGKAHQALIL